MKCRNCHKNHILLFANNKYGFCRKCWRKAHLYQITKGGKDIFECEGFRIR